MIIRSYTDRDRSGCLGVLGSNVPEYFLPEDRDHFAQFLDDLPGPYWVVEEAGAVVGCGGWALDEPTVAALTWGMVRRDLHRCGLGTRLIDHRLESIRDETPARRVRVRTIPRVQGFFERMGFRKVEVVPDGFGPGLDRVTMDRTLQPPG